MSLLVDLLSTCSLLGIWPRYIEPRLLKTTEVVWEIDPSYPHLDGIKIAHLSDLHFNQKVSKRFLQKIAKKVASQRPDMIVFTGDFLCYSQLEEKESLRFFLNQFEAPLGCYCSFGNHDYAEYASRNLEGIYDILPPPNPLKSVGITIKKLLQKQRVASHYSERVKKVPLHHELCALLQETPFMLLENRCISLPIGLHVAGLGDFALGRCSPEKTFLTPPEFPGIILSHNPDTLPLLLSIPGEWLILAGHTHGEQIHFPWPKWGRKISKKLTFLENPAYTRGWYTIENKKLYVNRGLGGHKPFRLFSPPEICFIQLKVKK